MKMLSAGGMDVLEDHIRTADQDNPKGYFEYERVKDLPEGDTAWLAEAVGKVVKIVAFFLPHLPDNYHYNIVFMHRAMPEILASQKAMMVNRGNNPDEIDVDKIARIYEKHLKQVDDWVKRQKNVRRVDVWYGEMMSNPTPQIQRITEFFNGSLDMELMRQAIDPNLYRQQKTRMSK